MTLKERLPLKDLMRLCFNAGRGDGTEHASGMGWDWWWKEYGRERYEEHLTEDAPPESAPAATED